MSQPLRAQGVVKRFAQGDSVVTALDGVDLEIETGELVAIMGASGSGKSTLLHALAGLTDIDGGRVLVDGQDLAQLSDARLTHFRREQIGLVFQSFNLIPTLTAEENVRLPALGTSGLDETVESLFHRLDLLPRRKHLPDALSGGEQQRVAIARALVCAPSILLLDEPTGSLDSVAGDKFCASVRTLCDEEERTIVLVTHEPGVARWADRVVVLRDGKVVDRFSTQGLNDAQQLGVRYHGALNANGASS